MLLPPQESLADSVQEQMFPVEFVLTLFVMFACMILLRAMYSLQMIGTRAAYHYLEVGGDGGGKGVDTMAAHRLRGGMRCLHPDGSEQVACLPGRSFVPGQRALHCPHPDVPPMTYRLWCTAPPGHLLLRGPHAPVLGGWLPRPGTPLPGCILPHKGVGVWMAVARL